jgi:hypothetical protein
MCIYLLVEADDMMLLFTETDLFFLSRSSNWAFLRRIAVFLGDSLLLPSDAQRTNYSQLCIYLHMKVILLLAYQDFFIIYGKGSGDQGGGLH